MVELGVILIDSSYFCFYSYYFSLLRGRGGKEASFRGVQAWCEFSRAVLRLLMATVLQVSTAFRLSLWQGCQDWTLRWEERRMAASSRLFGLASGRSQKSRSRGRLGELNS